MQKRRDLAFWAGTNVFNRNICSIKLQNTENSKIDEQKTIPINFFALLLLNNRHVCCSMLPKQCFTSYGEGGMRF